MDTAEEAAVRSRRGGRRREGRKKREAGMGGEQHTGGQSALTATGLAEWELSRFDRWTDRTTPSWQFLVLDASMSGRHQHALTQEHTQTP